jgi:hypothetical protein
MVVLYQRLGELPRVPDHLLADAVLDKGFLEQDIPTVFLIGEDIPNRSDRPTLLSSSVGDLLLFQPFLNHP